MDRVFLWGLLCLLLGLAPAVSFAQTPAQAPAPTAPQSKVMVRISGLVSKADSHGVIALDAAMLDALPEHSFTTSAPWFKGKHTFSGPLLSDVLAAVGATGTTLNLRALNDYRVQVPVSDALRYRPLLARKMDGKLLTVRDKGPLFLIYPFDTEAALNTDVYFARSIWQIKSIQVE